MKVTSNQIPEKQTGLERQLRSKEMTGKTSHSTNSPKLEEHGSENGAAKNETSQYLKVLSRVENLLIQNKLPDAAIEGFAGAVKNQIDTMSEEDRQMLMKLPEIKIMELDNLDDIPEMIKNDIKNEEKNAALLKLLRVPEFADLMRADNKTEPKTYTAQSALQPSPTKHEGRILSAPNPILGKPEQSNAAKVTENINQKINSHITNQ